MPLEGFITVNGEHIAVDQIVGVRESKKARLYFLTLKDGTERRVRSTTEDARALKAILDRLTNKQRN